MPIGIRPSGQFSGTRVARGVFRDTGRFGGVEFRWLPDWEKKTFDAVTVPGNRYAKMIHQAMVDAMSTVSRAPAGGGVQKNDDHWMVGIGSSGRTHLYWHLLEFGGGRHYARSPVRNALPRFGNFKPLAQGQSA